MRLRDHTFLGMTQSLCPECLALVPAKILDRGGRVYFRKRCPTHGVREDFICSDVQWFDRMEFSLPGKVPAKFGTLPDRGCPYDCGLCTEHEQHTCVGLVEITSSCNLQCPMCYASSGPGGKHLSFEEAKASIDRLVEVEGRAEVLQLSGGEPTIHPEFLRLLDYACSHAIDIVMINSNGLRFAHDPAFLEAVAKYRHRIEVYLQFDTFDDDACEKLRGERLVETKLKAVEALGKHGIRCILVTTLHPGVNDHEIGAIVRFGTRAAVGHGHQLPAGDLLRPARPPRRPGAAHHLPRRGQGGRVADRRHVPRGRLHAPALRPPQLPHAELRLPHRRQGLPARPLHRRAQPPRHPRQRHHLHPRPHARTDPAVPRPARLLRRRRVQPAAGDDADPARPERPPARGGRVLPRVPSPKSSTRTTCSASRSRRSSTPTTSTCAAS